MVLLSFKSSTAELFPKTVVFFSPGKVHRKDCPVTASQLQGLRAEALTGIDYEWGKCQDFSYPASLIRRTTGEKMPLVHGLM